MSLCTNFATKLPVVGSTIEATMVASSYLENRERIQMRQRRLETIRRGLEDYRRGGCRFASQSDLLDQRIGELRHQIHHADEEIKQEGREALKKAGMIILQEGAGAMIPGGGSIVAGVARARESILEAPNQPRQAIREGAREGAQDYCMAFAAEQVGQGMGCAIM